MPVCVGARAAGGACRVGGGGGMSGHTTGWCLALLYHSRLDGPGRRCRWLLVLPHPLALVGGLAGGGEEGGGGFKAGTGSNEGHKMPI